MRRLSCLLLLASGCATAHAAPAPLTLTYFGVAGWSISDGQHVVLVDPYFSRPADTEHAVPDEAAIAAHAPARADVILVGHGHVDHALDAPSVARRTGATLVGSAAVAAKAATAGVPAARIRRVSGGEILRFDGISIRVIPSRHSLIGAGQEVETLAYLVRIGGRQVLVFDTANFSERALADVHPDIALIATGLREAIPDYSCRLMRLLAQPKHVLPTHFDAWRQPAETPLTSDARADLDAFRDEIHRCAAAAADVTLPRPFVPLTIAP